jgi:acetyl esterase/lipase
LVSDDLRRRGYAVWNLEYRRVGHQGGGYPGTFHDVANGTDFIRKIAPDYHLDLNNIIAVGHSAGGHLVLWLSGRSKINSESPLYSDDPMKLSAIISLAGIGDLEQFRDYGNLVCSEGIINKLVNWEKRKGNNPFSDTSPIELAQEETPQVLIQAVYDPIVPPFLGYAYKRKLKEKNSHIKLITIDNSGHFELIAPWTEAWKEVLEQIEQILLDK